jgi:hypothetical protein
MPYRAVATVSTDLESRERHISYHGGGDDGRSDQVSMRLKKGMSIITVPKQCSVLTTTWATVQGTESHDPVVTWEVQQRHVHHLMNNDTALTLEVILRPRAVAEIGHKVKNRLSLGAFSTGETAAMILGGTALVIIFGAVGVLWFKARYGSLRELFSATVEKGIGETAEKTLQSTKV